MNSVKWGSHKAFLSTTNQNIKLQKPSSRITIRKSKTSSSTSREREIQSSLDYKQFTTLEKSSTNSHRWRKSSNSPKKRTHFSGGKPRGWNPTSNRAKKLLDNLIKPTHGDTRSILGLSLFALQGWVLRTLRSYYLSGNIWNANILLAVWKVVYGQRSSQWPF